MNLPALTQCAQLEKMEDLLVFDKHEFVDSLFTLGK
jgi:hypothetical protein